jgi:Fic family protein
VQPPTTLSADIARLIAEIDEFKGRWNALQTLTPDRLDALRRIATIESVGSSTRIEGAKLTDAQVETLLANLTLTRFETRDEQEVAGYAEAMDFVFESYADLGLTQNHLLQLHNILLRHSDKDERHRGDYKKLPNNVVAFDADGREIGIVFETTPPFATPREMEDLVAWVRKAVDEDTLHPLLIVGIFVVRFLAIHPFQDGNGRLSRILTNLLLLRAGYAYVPYASLESVIEENKEFYYQALRRTQTSFKTDRPDWDPWLGFFLRCLNKQKENLVRRLDRERSGQPGDDELPELSLKILSLFQERPRLTIAQITAFTGANRNTLKLRLRSLVEGGRLIRRGKARATWYALNEKGPR